MGRVERSLGLGGHAHANKDTRTLKRALYTYPHAHTLDTRMLKRAVYRYRHAHARDMRTLKRAV